MIPLTFGLSSYERAEGNLPPLDCVNMYAEVAATETTPATLQSRHGLADRGVTLGDGPVEAVFKRDGVLSGDLVAVSDGNIYRNASSLGSLAGTGPVSIAGNELGVMVAAGSTMRYYDGSTLADVAFPDSADVAHVFSGGSRFWAIREDTGKIYWTDALEADVEALDFATAESLPDKLLHGLWIDGMAVLFGAESVELWQQTGSSATPIRPMVNLVFERGIRATGCACAIGSTFAWVGNDSVVYLSNENTPISNEWLNAKIAASANVRLFTFPIDGVEFLCLRLDTETFVWRKATQTWSEFTTYGLTNWCAQCYSGGVFGSAVDGKTLEWGTGYTEALATSTLLERVMTAGIPVNDNGFVVSNMQLRTNPGNTPYLSGDYTNPTAELILSRDGGKTWLDPHFANLGAQGSYRTDVRWRNLGLAGRPGFLARVRVTDPVPFRVSEANLNVPYGGR